MSDIKDEISVNIDTAAKSVDMIKDYYYREHKRNKDRIKYGIIAILVIPIIFLTLLFVVNSSKVIFLVMWIASLFIISGYLIAIEYKDYNMTENLKDIVGNEYDDSLIDTAKAISDITKNYIKNGIQKNNMKNIFRVFANDWKRIGRNVVALVVVMGLSVLPSLYAWFNILSNWDPYGSDSTSNIKVAVAYDDTGIDISGMNVNISTNIIEALKTNDTIGWVFTDTSEEAIEGVWAGDYYAALIMPEDFSRDMVSFLADNMTHPEIIYYTNQKKNAIAPKITDKAKTAVQQQVNATFISSLTEAIMKSADIADNIGAIKDSDGNNINKENVSGNSILDILIAKLQVVNTQVSTFDSVLTAVSNIISTAQSTSDTAAAISPDLSVKFDSEKAILNELNNTIGKSNLIDSTIFANIANDINTIQGYMNSVSEIYDDMGYNVADFDNSISQMGSSIANTLELVHNLESQLSDSITKLVDFKSSGTYSLLQTAVAFNTEELASFISAPVTIGTVDLYPIENYGSAMSPFYSVLSIWVGALILVAIIHVKVHPFGGYNITSVQAFFGRYLTFFLIGQAQALLITLGDLFFIGIQCLHPFKFWLAASFTSFVFTMITYSLTVAFENVGEAVAIVIMVIQVAGAGGTFPIQCLPTVYQAIYKYLPFTYAMDALRECVGGTYSWYYWKCIIALLIYVGICLFIGLVVAIPCRKLNATVNKSKEKSGVMI